MRRPLVVLGIALVALLGLAVVALFSTRLQTWYAQRWLASRPELGVRVGEVSAGLRQVVIHDIRVQQRGLIITAPEIVAELPVLGALTGDQLAFKRLVAKGWRVEVAPDASGAADQGSSASAPGPVAAQALPASSDGSSGRTIEPSQPKTFSGVFPHLRLPFAVSIEVLELGGVVVSPNDVESNVTVRGGGLAQGQPGKFDVRVTAALPEAAVETIQVDGGVELTLADPRTVGGLLVDFQATAAGGRLEKPVTLHGTLAATRGNGAERYSLNVAADRELIALRADLPQGGSLLQGSWRLDLASEDLRPFVFGRPLPTFVLSGEGTITTDVAFQSVHAIGRLSGTADGLHALQPKLSEIGPVKLVADLDVTRDGAVIGVSKLDVDLATDQPVAQLRALQRFEVNLNTRAVTAQADEKELFGIGLQGMPVAWVRPWLESWQLTGTHVHGELVATPRAGGVSFRTKAPLSTTGLSVSYRDAALLRDVDVSFHVGGDSTPQGWQAEVSGLTLRHGGVTLAMIDTKAGSLAGGDQPIKATGIVSANLSALGAQPVLEGRHALSRGEVAVEFAGSMGARTELQARVVARNLEVDPRLSSEPLPQLSADIRADVGTDGTVTFKVPASLERKGQKSDLLVAGTLRHDAGKIAIDAQVGSNLFSVDDAKLLSLALPADRPDTEGQPTPPWAGLNGTLALQLKKLVYSDAFQLMNVTGTIRLSDGAARLENVRAGLGESGDATVSAAVTFDPAAPQPFTLAADLALSEFDPASLLRAATPDQPPLIDGKFAVVSKLISHSERLEALSSGVAGEFELTSRAGTFRGLPVNVGDLVENSGKLASWLASAGTAITSLTGKPEQDSEEITSRSKAASELARLLSAITYDQLNLVVTRDTTGNHQLKEFTLISPEVRIRGAGQSRVAGDSVFSHRVNLEFEVRVRGRAAELMKYLGVLQPSTDELGYAACTIPIRVSGTLARLDTTDLSNRLVAIAVAKSGLTEKAVDWINRLRGKSPN